MKVIVLAGGTSTERDVSIVTGTGICAALQRKGHKAFMLDVFFGCSDEMAAKAFDGEFTADQAKAYIVAFNPKLEEEQKSRKCFFGPNVLALCSQADKVFLALHGANGEDGRIQAAFDLMGIAYTGTDYLSSAIAMDKWRTKECFLLYGIPTPRAEMKHKDLTERAIADPKIQYPVVVKPCCGGSSIGVAIVKDETEYEKALDEAFLLEDRVIIEEYISGREFSVGVIDNKAYPVIEIIPKHGFYDYENKYKAGATIEVCPADIPEETAKKMRQIAVDGAKALRISGYSRLDFIMDKDGNMYCLEANTLPGMTPTSLIPQEAQVLGIGYDELCEILLGL